MTATAEAIRITKLVITPEGRPYTEQDLRDFLTSEFTDKRRAFYPGRLFIGQMSGFLSHLDLNKTRIGIDIMEAKPSQPVFMRLAPQFNHSSDIGKNGQPATQQQVEEERTRLQQKIEQSEADKHSAIFYKSGVNIAIDAIDHLTSAVAKRFSLPAEDKVRRSALQDYIIYALTFPSPETGECLLTEIYRSIDLALPAIHYPEVKTEGESANKLDQISKLIQFIGSDICVLYFGMREDMLNNVRPDLIDYFISRHFSQEDARREAEEFIKHELGEKPLVTEDKPILPEPAP